MRRKSLLIFNGAVGITDCYVRELIYLVSKCRDFQAFQFYTLNQ